MKTIEKYSFGIGDRFGREGKAQLEAFQHAKAEINGNTVILDSVEVPEPQALRFAWNKLAMPNLVNDANLPAAAFRASVNEGRIDR
ncbi:MAG: hypothetical protein U9P12_10180 [Verrucomicrobiota bacterium]|nr:hypothetical protein [Verrucomicrobiota bacterium]